jgi:hypothetical protein
MRHWMIAAGALLLASCAQNPPDTSAAEQGVTRFRRQMDSRQFQEIYDNAAPEFRQNASESTVIRFLNLVSTRLGRALAASKQGLRLDTNTSGSFVTLTYTTTFDRGRGNEEFVFRMDGPEARLAGYHINSLDLMMDQLDPNGNTATPASNGADAVTEIRAMSNQPEPAPATR